jgi:tRNA threonylcarbamoyladenosine biosynthesis protein TsaB
MKKDREQTAERKTILLGIESSGVTCAVGVSAGNRLLMEISANIRNIHSQKLAPFVEYALQTAGLQMQEINAIVLSAGPGSFTGLRIGYSVAKGLAHALKIPLIEVPTLDVWAYQAGEQPNPLMPVIDAHRGEIFCAVYQWELGALKLSRDYALVKPAALPEFLQAPVVLTGADARKLYPQLESHLPPGSHLLYPSPESPQVWALLELGFEKYHQGQFADLNSCEPFYMRTFQGIS